MGRDTESLVLYYNRCIFYNCQVQVTFNKLFIMDVLFASWDVPRVNDRLSMVARCTFHSIVILVSTFERKKKVTKFVTKSCTRANFDLIFLKKGEQWYFSERNVRARKLEPRISRNISKSSNVRRVINSNKFPSNGQFGHELHLVRRYLEPPLSPFRRHRERERQHRSCQKINQQR